MHGPNEAVRAGVDLFLLKSNLAGIDLPPDLEPQSVCRCLPDAFDPADVAPALRCQRGARQQHETRRGAEDLTCPACRGEGEVRITPDLPMPGGASGVVPVRVLRT